MVRNVELSEKKNDISAVNRIRRTRYRSRLGWPVKRNWENVFSDETKVIYGTDNKIRISREGDEKLPGVQEYRGTNGTTKNEQASSISVFELNISPSCRKWDLFIN